MVEARANSKRLSRKHEATIGYQSLIEHALDTALTAARQDCAVAISTNDPWCKICAAERGVPNIDRPAELFEEKLPVREFLDGLADMYAGWVMQKGWELPIKLVRSMGNTLITDDAAYRRTVEATINMRPEDRGVHMIARCRDGLLGEMVVRTSPTEYRYLDADASYKASDERAVTYEEVGGPTGMRLGEGGFSKYFDGNFRTVIVERTQCVHVHDDADLAVARAFWPLHAKPSESDPLSMEGKK